MCASLGCGVLLGPISLGIFLFLGRDSTEAPFAKPPFPWRLTIPALEMRVEKLRALGFLPTPP